VRSEAVLFLELILTALSMLRIMSPVITGPDTMMPALWWSCDTAPFTPVANRSAREACVNQFAARIA